jgi:hypothetical protein
MVDFANLIERGKEPAIQDFGTIGTIKAFNEGVLIRLGVQGHELVARIMKAASKWKPSVFVGLATCLTGKIQGFAPF